MTPSNALARHALLRAAAASVAALVGLALVPVAASTGASSSEGRAQLGREARDWLSTLTEQAQQQISLSAPDPRIQVTACERTWTFDLPFGPGQALRARCSRPSQQVFLMTQAVRGPFERTRQEPTRDERALAEPPLALGPGPAGSTEASLTQAWVLALSLSARTPLSAQHLVQAELPAHLLREDQVRDLDSLHHMELIRPLKAGSPLRKSDLRPIKLVKRGDFVSVSVEPVDGLRIQARLEATEDGVWGQRIRLKNPQSGRITTAQVSGPGLAVGF